MPTMTEPLRLAPDHAAPPGPSGAERGDPSSFEAFFEVAESRAVLGALPRDPRPARGRGAHAGRVRQGARGAGIARADRRPDGVPVPDGDERVPLQAPPRRASRCKRAIGQAPHDDAYEQIESMDAALRALASLSERQRAAVVLTGPPRLLLRGGGPHARRSTLDACGCTRPGRTPRSERRWVMPR